MELQTTWFNSGKHTHREEKAFMVFKYCKAIHPDFIEKYTEGKANPYTRLMQVIQRLAYNHELKHQHSALSKLTIVQKKDARKQFNKCFKMKYSHMACKNTFNLKMMGIWHDPIPYIILAHAGESTTIAITKKHSGRMTVVLGVSASGKKLPILFILGSSKTRKIAGEELQMYPQ
jgi:hypothetical protein